MDMEPEHERIVRRPPDVINGLSPPQQWEVTRRHPYYLLFWQQASSANEADSEAGQLLRDAARLILTAINFVGPPQPPSKSAEDLGITAQSGAFRHGAVSRVTVRSLVGMLASPVFPNETKRAIAELLLRSCDVDLRIPSAECHAFLRELTQGSHPHFDDSLPDLIVSINPLAPGRSAASAVQEIIRNYKAEHKLPEQRRREDKFDDYLKIWDLREGWTGAGYDVSREMRLKEIAGELRRSISTVQNRYRSAFRNIVGHDYTPALWLQVVGLPKFHGFFGSALPRAWRRRLRSERRPRDIPATALEKYVGPEEGRLVGILQANCPTFGNLGEFELMSDVGDLIDRGQTNEQIVEELELRAAEALDLINYLRGRRDDRL
jgi:hypothetical protein